MVRTPYTALGGALISARAWGGMFSKRTTWKKRPSSKPRYMPKNWGWAMRALMNRPSRAWSAPVGGWLMPGCSAVSTKKELALPKK